MPPKPGSGPVFPVGSRFGRTDGPSSRCTPPLQGAARASRLRFLRALTHF